MRAPVVTEVALLVGVDPEEYAEYIEALLEREKTVYRAARSLRRALQLPEFT